MARELGEVEFLHKTNLSQFNTSKIKYLLTNIVDIAVQRVGAVKPRNHLQMQT